MIMIRMLYSNNAKAELNFNTEGEAMHHKGENCASKYGRRGYSHGKAEGIVSYHRQC